jgi:hypothetical protein
MTDNRLALIDVQPQYMNPNEKTITSSHAALLRLCNLNY